MAKEVALATVVDIPLATKLEEVMEEMTHNRVRFTILANAYSRLSKLFAGYNSGGYQQPESTYSGGKF